jgi:hypothetical protein
MLAKALARESGAAFVSLTLRMSRVVCNWSRNRMGIATRKKHRMGRTRGRAKGRKDEGAERLRFLSFLDQRPSISSC